MELCQITIQTYRKIKDDTELGRADKNKSFISNEDNFYINFITLSAALDCI